MGKAPKWPKGSNDCRSDKRVRVAMAAYWDMTDRDLEKNLEETLPNSRMTEDQRIDKRAWEILLQPEYRARRARVAMDTQQGERE